MRQNYRAKLQNGYVASAGDEKGHNRQVRQTALDLLKKSGYAIVDGRLAHKRSGDALSSRYLFKRQDERLALTYSRMLNGIGVIAKVRCRCCNIRTASIF